MSLALSYVRMSRRPLLFTFVGILNPLICSVFDGVMRANVIIKEISISRKLSRFHSLLPHSGYILELFLLVGHGIQAQFDHLLD